jgi:hypothetical protein
LVTIRVAFANSLAWIVEVVAKIFSGALPKLMLLEVAIFSSNEGSTEFKMAKDEVLPDMSLFFFLIASALSCIFLVSDLFLSLLRTTVVPLFLFGNCGDR